MNIYKLITALSIVSLNGFFGKHENYTVSIQKALTVVFVYNGCDKKDKDCKQQMNALLKTFNSVKKDPGYRRIGVAMIDVDLSKSTEFADTYLEHNDSQEPKILFFKRGLLLEDETIFVNSEKEWAKKLRKKLNDPKGAIGTIVSDLQEEYEEYREEEAQAARVSAMSIMYPTAADIYYNGLYQPFYPYNTYWGFGGGLGYRLGIGGLYYRRCL